jgi:T5SS/PEP-CTERM-associated repeat protein
MFVGQNNGSTGTLTIAEGLEYGSIGLVSTANGTVSVTGAGSKWTNTTYLDIGDAGTGTLTIGNGGTVSAGGTVPSPSRLARPAR